MSLNGIIRRASSFLGLSGSENSKPTYEDGDIVFCECIILNPVQLYLTMPNLPTLPTGKNNVCVHPPWRCRGDGEKVHHPGYLVIKCQADPSYGTTLHLSWIPNERLKRNHDLISQIK
ncbi:TBC1 domain family member 16 [Portunus trituberculatus]|uniref:TBC1 domain family member 16 n=1 Tax=Portunus trituberculatus TaxID=210409 RepID=A0A5B7J595_PORTR|nr:TBC1 domain family member 16 [Portunus trituberculatus]